jgi:hypothetical protein
MSETSSEVPSAARGFAGQTQSAPVAGDVKEGRGRREMHWIGLWWRQLDHYDWLSDYLGSRGLKPFVRYLLTAIVTNLAAATLLMLISSSGPHTPMRRRAVAGRARAAPG